MNGVEKGNPPENIDAIVPIECYDRGRTVFATEIRFPPFLAQFAFSLPNRLIEYSVNYPPIKIHPPVACRFFDA